MTHSPIHQDVVRVAPQRLLRPKGSAPDAAAQARVQAVLTAHPHLPRTPGLLIEWLHHLNDAHGALHRGTLAALAPALGLTPAQVVEVASFYAHFAVLDDDQPAPRAVLRVCTSLACAQAGSAALLAHAQALAAAGIVVQAAPCVGHCACAPAALWGTQVLAPVAQQTLAPLLVSDDEKPAIARVDAAWTAPEPIAYRAYRCSGGYARAAALVNGEDDAQAVLDRLAASGARGLGGAGFPAARKWQAVRALPGPRALVVNLDEGEPGTFKDRHWVQQDPHRLLEGMLIAAQVVGTEAVYLYVRDEYAALRATLTQALADLHADPPCPLPELHLRRGAGAYVCGEESALIESLQGRRGQPRLRPPYVAQVGLNGWPTLEHNAETLFWLRDLLDDDAHQGRSVTALRSYSVSGRVRSPGVKRAPAGISVRRLIEDHCGGMADGCTLYGYLPGGASGGILPAHLADLPLDFGALEPHGAFIGSAAVIVLGTQDRARDAAAWAMHFLADESCGQCTPCRVGTAQAVKLMAAPVWDAPTLLALCDVMADGSICGLGQAAPNPIRCVLRHFAHEVDGRDARA